MIRTRSVLFFLTGWHQVECAIKHFHPDLASACLCYESYAFFVLLDVSVCCMCACTPVHVCFTIAVKIHEKHSLQSLRASTATPCDAVVSMSYKYTLLSSEGSQHSNTLIPHPLFLLYGCVCVCINICSSLQFADLNICLYVCFRFVGHILWSLLQSCINKGWTNYMFRNALIYSA